MSSLDDNGVPSGESMSPTPLTSETFSPLNKQIGSQARTSNEKKWLWFPYFDCGYMSGR